jgi:hypothetical protein
MEVTQFTYFQQVGGFDCRPVSGEITYGLERLAMYVQGVDRVYDLNFNGRTDARKLTYGDVFLQAEQEYSRFNFEHADTDCCFSISRTPRPSAKRSSRLARPRPAEGRHQMALPAYDQCIKASHVFNLLDARGVISVTERQSYICACAIWRRPAVRPGSRPKAAVVFNQRKLRDQWCKSRQSLKPMPNAPCWHGLASGDGTRSTLRARMTTRRIPIPWGSQPNLARRN